MLRRKKKLTIRALASKAGVGFTTISALELGYQQRTSVINASRLATALDADLVELIPELKRTG